MDGEIMIYCPYGVERFKEFFNNKRWGDENRISRFSRNFFRKQPSQVASDFDLFLRPHELFNSIEKISMNLIRNRLIELKETLKVHKKFDGIAVQSRSNKNGYSCTSALKKTFMIITIFIAYNSARYNHFVNMTSLPNFIQPHPQRHPQLPPQWNL